MLTENNTLNWIRFMRLILDDKECSKQINSFIKKEKGISFKYTSANIYKKYCK